MLLSNTLFIRVDLACVYLLLVEIGSVVNVAILMYSSSCQSDCAVALLILMVHVCKSVGTFKHSICHVTAKTGHYMTTSFWGQA